MVISDPIQFLQNRVRFGVKLGLQTISALLKEVDHPQNLFKTIHIAGTNAKGSTAWLIHQLLHNHGYKTGLFISPHVIYLNERIQINNIPISNPDFLDMVSTIQSHSERLGATFFEVLTAAAFLYFARQNVDYAVIETGLGGTFDSTNVITPELSIITTISFDHEAQLGSTLTSIAENKAGIIKKGVPVLTGELPEEARIVIEKKAAIMGSDCIRPVIDDRPLFVRLAGKAFSMLTGEPESSVNLQIEQIIKTNKSWIGRYHHVQLNAGRTIILDGAHNPAAMAYLTSQLLQDGVETPDLIFGCAGDKDSQSLLRILSELNTRITLTLPMISRNQTMANLIEQAKRYFENVTPVSNVRSALKDWLKNSESKILVICGSFYLLNEAYLELIEQKYVDPGYVGLTINQ